MSGLNRKLYRTDGSFDIEAAIAAGRETRARDLWQGCTIVYDAATGVACALWRAALALHKRNAASSRSFGGTA